MILPLVECTWICFSVFQDFYCFLVCKLEYLKELVVVQHPVLFNQLGLHHDIAHGSCSRSITISEFSRVPIIYFQLPSSWRALLIYADSKQVVCICSCADSAHGSTPGPSTYKPSYLCPFPCSPIWVQCTNSQVSVRDPDASWMLDTFRMKQMQMYVCTLKNLF